MKLFSPNRDYLAKRPEVPDDIRAASHRLANEVAKLQGLALDVKRSADALSALAQDARRPWSAGR